MAHSYFNFENGFCSRLWTEGWQWALLLTLVSLSGCGGCRPESEKLTREELEERAKRRESLETGSLLSLPADTESKILTAKPGHWFETQQQFKSNREDLQVVAVGSIARGTETVKIPGTNVINEFTRRTSLPKGQTKTIDLQYYVPPSLTKAPDPADFTNINPPSTALSFRTELLAWPLMTPITQVPIPTAARELKENEFQLAVMSPQPLNYEFMSALDTVFWRADELMLEERVRSYYVTLVRSENNAYAFPHSMLTMTATAVLVWDDVAPHDLSHDQQQAIVDWLHWGGQLIVSGPSSWSRLQDSFLSPYLPAVSAEAVELETTDFAELSRTWAVEDISRSRGLEPLEILGQPMAGLKFNLGQRGQWLPHTGELVAESQIGRGRVILTSFSMREPRVYRWKYFSSFLSSGLLRRPARTVSTNRETKMLSQVWASPLTGSERDARLHSNIRILSRDLPLAESASRRQPNGQSASESLNTPSTTSRANLESLGWGGGGAAWNDYSGLAFEVIGSLRAAAGIELPSRKTIIYLLAGYLTCLVPLNWLVFRAIGRLEYAWLAAPLLALAGVVVVTRVARLDIGFARRTTEIAVLELHEDHPRAHLTQYLALYTSLSTNYAVDFPETGSVALPLGDTARAQRRAATSSRTLRTNYGRSAGVTLEPLTVYSNSTEMVHAEQMVPLQGGLQLGTLDTGAAAIKNKTGLDLRAALLVRMGADQGIEYAWLGALDSGDSAPLSFQTATADALLKPWQESPITQADLPPEIASGDSLADQYSALWVGGVLHAALRKTPLMPGQTRLFAYSDDRPGDLTVKPAEDQYDGRCVVVAHLTPQTLPQIQPDLLIMSRNTTPLEEAQEDAPPQPESDEEGVMLQL